MCWTTWKPPNSFVGNRRHLAVEKQRQPKAVNNQQGYYKHVFAAAVTHDPLPVELPRVPPTFHHPPTPNPFVNTHTHTYLTWRPLPSSIFACDPKQNKRKTPKMFYIFRKTRNMLQICEYVWVCECVWVLGAWQSRAYPC